ncbi:MAG: polysaccharide deacetylase family protein [Dehalococcoidia bacterium]|nr:polysaccharide deacetylase family protein [Dehalococcoidia bacterium]
MTAVQELAGLARRGLRRAGVRRARLVAERMRLERSASAVRRRGRAARTEGRILAYHAVGTPAWAFNDLAPRRFAHQLELALEAGYRFVHPDAIARGEGAPDELAVSFDDGLASVLHHAPPVLASLGIPWTTFIVSDWAEQGHAAVAPGTFANWRDVERMAELGGTIGSYSVTHPNFARLSPDQTAHELGESRRVIEARTDLAPATFAIPYGQSRDWTAEAHAAALAAGYALVYAQAMETRFPGTVARTKIARTDTDHVFRAALRGAYDRWEEQV